jgi:hypothetical protein
MLALSSPTRGDRSVGIVDLRTQATEFFFVIKLHYVTSDDWIVSNELQRICQEVVMAYADYVLEGLRTGTKTLR